MNIELNDENDKSQQDVYGKITRQRFRDKPSETGATADLLLAQC